MFQDTTSPRFSSLEDMTVNSMQVCHSELRSKLDYTGNEESRSYLPTMARLGLVMICIWMIEQNGNLVEGSKLWFRDLNM
jgi:hypothetical protein